MSKLTQLDLAILDFISGKNRGIREIYKFYSTTQKLNKVDKSLDKLVRMGRITVKDLVYSYNKNN